MAKCYLGKWYNLDMEKQEFDGKKEAQKREKLLRKRVEQFKRPLRMCSIVFEEDAGSQLYTRIKFEAANRVGIEFDRVDLSLRQPIEFIREEVQTVSERLDIDGVMVQKPMRQVWRETMKRYERGMFSAWWREVSSAVNVKKDVDCLHPEMLDKVYLGKWHIVPATVKAVLSILEIALHISEGGLSTHTTVGLPLPLKNLKVAVIGRSEIVGRPLAAILTQKGAKVALVGSQVEDLGFYTVGADVVVSGTGVPGIITEDIVKPGVILIDVGSPKADVSRGCFGDAAFITPVPGGVGPMTVVSLLENLVELIA